MVLDEGQWSTTRSVCFTIKEENDITHGIGGWLVTGVGLDVLEKRKKLLARRRIEIMLILTIHSLLTLILLMWSI